MSSLHVVFDWDGTLSFIRAGWGEVMLRQWLEFLPSRPGETPEALSALAHHEIWALNGRPSIHQMERLAELVTERGGTPLTPDGFHDDFQARLGRLIRERTTAIQSGVQPADHFMVLGGRAFLRRLQEAGIGLHVVSGTPRPFVSGEVDCLGLRPFFGERILGPVSLTDTAFHKRRALRQIIDDHGLDPATQLVSFGDGVTEIVETVAAGGRAVAVAADEENWHSGQTDVSKQSRLLAAGAEFCIPDYAGIDTWLPRVLSRPA
jgi:phosphoglycolate phosphatase-like HAD superfamily hydrolase